MGFGPFPITGKTEMNNPWAGDSMTCQGETDLCIAKR